MNNNRLVKMGPQTMRTVCSLKADHKWSGGAGAGACWGYPKVPEKYSARLSSIVHQVLGYAGLAPNKQGDPSPLPRYLPCT